MEVFFDSSEIEISGEILEFEGVFDDVVEFEFGAVLVAVGFGEGVLVAGGCEFEPALEFGCSGAGVLEFHFGGEVPDELVFLGADGADAVVVRAVVDPFGGHDAVDVFLVALFSGEDGKEAFAREGRGWGASGCFDEGGEEVEVLDHGGVGGAGFYFSGPAGDEGGLEAVVVAGPFGEGEAAALLGGDDEEGVISEVVFFDEVHRLADLGIEVGDLGEVAAHTLASYRGVDEVRGKLYFVGGVAGAVAFVPGGVWFVGAEEETEGLFRGGLFRDEGAHFLEFGVLSAGDFFPVEDFSGGDVGFAGLGDGVVEGGEVLHDAFGGGWDEGVVGVSSAEDGGEAGVYVVSGGGAHGGGLEAAGEAHALGGKLVDVWGMGLSSVAAEVAEGAVVGDDEDDVGLCCAKKL